MDSKESFTTLGDTCTRNSDKRAAMHPLDVACLYVDTRGPREEIMAMKNIRHW